ncbi:MAG: peroxiredoxin family protein [Acidimicrobiales bacterium]
MTALLSPGDTFPALSVLRSGGGRINLPEDLAGAYGVVLFYRGSWCPYCNAQLRAFERAGGTLADAGARVVALSVDDEATTAALVERHRLTMPIGYGADATVISAATGAFVDDQRGYLESTGFILDPSGKVTISVYSSGAIGRLVPEDVVGMLRYLQEHPPAA